MKQTVHQFEISIDDRRYEDACKYICNQLRLSNQTVDGKISKYFYWYKVDIVYVYDDQKAAYGYMKRVLYKCMKGAEKMYGIEIRGQSYSLSDVCD